MSDRSLLESANDFALMEIRRGIAVSPGVAIGPALVLDTEGVRIPQRTVEPEQIPAEIARLGKALGEAARTARDTRERIAARLGQDIGNIFGAQQSAFEDDSFRLRIEQLIRAKNFSAEYAVSRGIREYVKKFEEAASKLGDSAGIELRRRATELIDLEKQVLAILLGHANEPLLSVSAPVIVVATDLMPSDTADFTPRTVRAFATESGGPTSHTAILAGALEIPAVVGVGRFLTDVSGGDLVIVDGERGLVILDPDERTIAEYEEKRANLFGPDGLVSVDARQAGRNARRRRHPPLGQHRTGAGAGHCTDRGAEGIGLYRTEFLYLNKTADPTEAEHYEAYCAVLQTLGPDRPVVIRTLDLGADKFANMADDMLGGEKNPFLGLRSVRLCLRKLDLFKTQMRAILRAAVRGDVRIMFPMISTVEELRQCRDALERSTRRSRRRQNPLQIVHPSWYDDRSAVGGAHGGRPGQGSGFLLDRDERSGAVHAGGGSEQRERGPPLQPGGSGRTAADSHGGGGGQPGRDRCERVRGDERRTALHPAAHRPRVAATERNAPEDTGH